MATKLDTARQNLPELRSLDDDEAVKYLHRTYYSDIDINALYGALGVERKEGVVEGLGKAFKSGVGTTKRNVGASVDALTGDLPSAMQRARDAQQAQPERPLEAQRFEQSLQQRREANPDAGLGQAIQDVGGAIAERPQGAAQMLVEQLPNAAPALAGGWAGMKGGAAAGSFFGPAGTFIGGALGGLTGLFLGNFLIETGGKVVEKASDGSYTPEENREALAEGAKKSLVLTGVDAATLGVGRVASRLLSREAIEAGARAEAQVLRDAGVDVSSPQVVQMALQADKSLANQAALAGERAAQEATTRGVRIGRAGTELGLQSVGEGVGEYAGEQFAAGEASVHDAVLEGVMGLGQSAAEVAWNVRQASGNRLAAAGIVKASEAAGLDPATGPLTDAAAQAVDNEAARMDAVQAGIAPASPEVQLAAELDQQQAAQAQPLAEGEKPPENWRKDYVQAARVAKSLGIERPSEYTLPELVKAIDNLRRQQAEMAEALEQQQTASEQQEEAPVPRAQQEIESPEQDESWRTNYLQTTTEARRLGIDYNSMTMGEVVQRIEQARAQQPRAPENIPGVPTPQLSAEQAVAASPSEQEGATSPAAGLSAARKAVKAMEKAAHQAATSPLNKLPEPTQAQKEAGNYKVGRLRIAGMDISVENPQGSARRGVDADGKPWETPMRHHYGYFRQTTANDGDKLDVFVVPGTVEDFRGPVFVVDQIDPKTGKLDEHKVILGARDEADAEAIYRSNYTADWQGFGAITRLPLAAFKAWAKSGNKKEALGDIEAASQQIQQAQKAAPQTAAADQAADGGNGADRGDEGAVRSDRAAADERAADESAAVADDRRAAGRGPDRRQDVERRRRVQDMDADEQQTEKIGTNGHVITDFGEKLPPARRAMAAKLDEELSDDKIASLPFSQIWPAAENEAIEDTFAAAVAHALRAAIPAKPRVSYKVKRWVDQVKTLRDLAATIVSGRVTRDDFLKRSYSAQLQGFIAKIKLLEKLDRADWKRIDSVDESPNAIRYNKDGTKTHSPHVYVKIDGKYHNFEGSGDVLQHVDAVKAILGNEVAERKMQFEIRQERGGKRTVFINKKGDGEYRHLMEFDKVEDARAAIKNRYDELVAAWEGVKNRDNISERDLRTAENRPRTGKDHRGGKDVTVEQFRDTFGFRGGEFGKWVSQGSGAQERQHMLNSAYDALMDLSDILGIPPRAISLDGTLGIAFGSRGSGWASAHFEPSNLVINLTKPRGAGALGHEWFHALDNYFARKRGGEVPALNSDQYRRENFITYKTTPMMVRKDGRGSKVTKERLKEWRKNSPGNPYYAEDQWIEDPKHKAGVRAEVEQRFDDLVKALNESPMLKRSMLLDSKKSGEGYWSQTIERAARAFENYLQHRMMEQGYHNDFLANVRPAGDVNKNKGRYPYLLPDEVAPIAEAFDNLFQTIETRTDEDGNVGMFARGGVDQTDTPEFKRWFGGSKVVDADGKPLVMYHGTSKNEGGEAFTAFDTYASNYGLMGQGGYFTANPEVASSYTSKGKGTTPTVYPVYLSIKNPIDMDAKADPAAWQKQFDGIEDFHEEGDTNESWYRAAEEMITYQEVPMYEGAEIMQEGLRAMGHDGITHMGGGRVKSDGVKHRVYVAFDPEQIKSATGNRGTFDPENRDISFARGLSTEAFKRAFAPPPAMTVERMRKMVEELTAKWTDGPQFTVVSTAADLPFAAPPDARGWVSSNGQGYIVAENNPTRMHLARTLGHEAIGHYGLWKILGRDGQRRFENNMKLALAAGNKPLNRIRYKVRKDYVDGAGKFNLSPDEEVNEIAAYAVEDAIDPVTGEFKPGFAWLKRFFAQIAAFLRDTLGLPVRFTYTELQGMLVDSMRGLEAGKRLDGRAEVLVAAARGDQPVQLPDAIVGSSLGAATSHPDYEAAKGGDTRAAVNVAKALVTDDLVAKVRAAIGDSKPVIVPVVSEEAAGRNKIPRAAAEELGRRLGLETASDVVQANRAHRTGMDGLDRIFAVPQFDGPVEAGRDYLLLDDTLTQGATFATLANHIEQGGGRVVGAVALTGKQYSATMRASAETLKKLRDKHGDLEQDFRAATGYGFDALTQSEARYLANFEPAQQVRDRIAEAGRRARQGRDSQAPGSLKDGALARGAPTAGGPIAAITTPKPVSQSAQFFGITADQRAALDKAFSPGEVALPPKERIRSLFANAGTRLRQGLADQFAPIAQIDQKAYMQARMSKGTDGATEAAMMFGRPFLRDGVLDVDIKDGGFAQVLADLKGEQDRFLMWVAAQRSERLKAEGRENLLTDADISSLKSLNAGKMPDGRPRLLVYANTLKRLNEFNEAALKVALESGLIDQAAFDLMRDQPYVPFYRVMEDGDMRGPTFSSGLTNQQAFKKLKGGKEKLNADLLHNLLLNWHHLFQASAKNRAALATMDAAEKLAIAYRGTANDKGAIKVMRDGHAEYWNVEDPYLLQAVSALHYVPGSVAKALAPFKRLLTWGVTISPVFKIRNLIRDSVSAIGTSPLGANPFANVRQGIKATAKDTQTYASMLAAGGVIRFGTQENSQQARAQITKLGGQMLDKKGWEKLTGQMKAVYDAYQELGDRAENANRAALYEQMRAKGYSHAEASFMARDLMDFSMSGSWELVRFLAQTVPFLNARIQGLYKLGRAAKEEPARFAAVTSAVALASLALLLQYEDDEDWKRREDWDRDTYWWFKIGDQAFRIPKPFEIGAIGTIAERTAELVLSKEMDNKRFRDRLSAMLFQTFSFDPTPQALKPLVDIFANKDSFTGRAIETQAEQRLRPQDRADERTSSLARLLGQIGLPDPAQLAKGEYAPLSPKQIDHLLRGYLGWVATSIQTTTDYGLRPALGLGERPEKALRDVFLVGNFTETLPQGSSRYVTLMYEQARAADQAWASVQAALKAGDREEAAQIMRDEVETLSRRKVLNNAAKLIGDMNRMARRIESDRNLSGPQKRMMLDQIAQKRHEVAKRAVSVP